MHVLMAYNGKQIAWVALELNTHIAYRQGQSGQFACCTQSMGREGYSDDLISGDLAILQISDLRSCPLYSHFSPDFSRKKLPYGGTILMPVPDQYELFWLTSR